MSDPELKIRMSDLETIVGCTADFAAITHILQDIYEENEGVRWDEHGRSCLSRMNSKRRMLGEYIVIDRDGLPKGLCDMPPDLETCDCGEQRMRQQDWAWCNHCDGTWAVNGL